MTNRTIFFLSMFAVVAASQATVKPALPPEPEKPRACQVVTATDTSDLMQYDDAMKLSKGYALIGMDAAVQCRPELKQAPLLNASLNLKGGNIG
jgi:hypothetical protein